MLTDRLARRDQRWIVWAPAIGLLLSAPLYVAGFLAPTKQTAMAILLAPPALQYIYLGPTMGLMHNMVTPRMRATATALLYLSVNLFGMGLGPTITGLLSDRFAAGQFSKMLPESHYDLQCIGGVAGPNATEALNTACASAAAHGIRWALITTTLALVVSAMLYLRAARTLRKDLL
jgi:MFS family permease